MKRQDKLVKVGITLGDPAGVGPEIVLKALNKIKDKAVIPVVIGRRALLESYFPASLKKITAISTNDIPEKLYPAKKYILDIGADTPLSQPGCGNSDSALESISYVNAAVDLCKRGLIDAMVTGPVNKGLIEKAGIAFTGHTEYIADMLGEPGPYMMMFSDDYRVLLVTTHIAVADVALRVTERKIYDTVMAGHKAIRAIDGTGKVKIAIAGLDPHSGDDGAIGSFDSDVTKRVVAKCRAEGVDIDGPFAADTIFLADKWRGYNLVIAHYHDQGLIPFKMLAFDSGVNVTLGLSIIRTSPDHGTGFDIAGKGMANYKSMLNAILLAAKLARKKSIA